MSAPATPGGRRSTCSIWGGPTSTGSASRAVSACRARGSRIWRNSTGGSPTLARAGREGGVGLNFLGHASFLIESPQGVTIVTDYNDMIRAPVTPDIVTMNNAHPTHYTDAVEPGVKFVLRGWDPAGGIATHHVDYRDVKIHNVPTNVREFGGTR